MICATLEHITAWFLGVLWYFASDGWKLATIWQTKGSANWFKKLVDHCIGQKASWPFCPRLLSHKSTFNLARQCLEVTLKALFFFTKSDFPESIGKVLKPIFLGGICVLVFLSYTQNLIPMRLWKMTSHVCGWEGHTGAHRGTGEVFLQLILLPIGPNAVAGVVENWGRFSYLIFCK